jgi:hypothetical protein
VIGQSFPCKKEDKHLRGYKMRRKKNMIAPDSILFNFFLFALIIIIILS